MREQILIGVGAVIIITLSIKMLCIEHSTKANHKNLKILAKIYLGLDRGSLWLLIIGWGVIFFEKAFLLFSYLISIHF